MDLIWNILLHKVKQLYLVIVSPFNGFASSCHEEFTFDIEIPALALVRFVVEDFDMSTKNDFIGQYTLPFTSLKQGKALLPVPHNH